MQQQII